jgi:hypothetical protein
VHEADVLKDLKKENVIEFYEKYIRKGAPQRYARRLIRIASCSLTFHPLLILTFRAVLVSEVYAHTLEYTPTGNGMLQHDEKKMSLGNFFLLSFFYSMVVLLFFV